MNTSKLIRHLKYKHPDEYNIINTRKIELYRTNWIESGESKNNISSKLNLKLFF